MRRLAALTGLTLMCFSAGLAGQDVAGTTRTVEQLLSGMQAYEQTIEDVRLEFTQEIEFTSVKEKYVTESIVVFRKPDKLWFEQLSPQVMKIVSNGKKVYVYNPVTNQVFTDLWKNWKGIDYFLPGFFSSKNQVPYLQKYFDITMLDMEGGSYVMRIVPKKQFEKSKYFPGKFEMYMWVDGKELYPVKGKYVSESVTCVTEVKSWQINRKPDSSMFEFKAPKDAEYLKLR